MSSGQLPGGCTWWAWLVLHSADPSHRALLAMWVEGYARSLLGEPEPWAVFGRDTVSDWLDLLATGDTARVTAAGARHLHAIGGFASAGDARHRTVMGEEH